MPTIHPLVVSRQLLSEAENHRRQKQYAAAKKICEDLLSRYPDYYGALHTMGLVLADTGSSRQALGFLAQAHAYFPENPSTLIALGTVYLEIGARDKAIECLQKALELNGDSATLFVTLGQALDQESDYEGARDAYAKALALNPEWSEAESLLAFAYEHLGETRKAYDIFARRVVAGDRSLSTIAAVLNSPIRGKELISSEVFSGVPVDEQNSRYLFARGHFKILEGQFKEGWNDLVSANRLKASAISEQRKENRIWQGQSLSYVSGFDLTAAPDNPDLPYSLYILGPSRSGKTTVEGIISAYQAVNRGYENSIPTQAVRKMFRRAGYPTSFQWPLLPKGVEGDCNDEYQKLLRNRSKSARVFTNTSPARIHDVYRIISVIPNTRIVFVRRNIDDNALRVFFKNYARGNFYGYDLSDIYDHIRWYEKMSEAICRRFPDKCIILDYEKVINDPSIALSATKELCPDVGQPSLVHPIKGDVGFSHPFLEILDPQRYS